MDRQRAGHPPFPNKPVSTATILIVTEGGSREQGGDRFREREADVFADDDWEGSKVGRGGEGVTMSLEMHLQTKGSEWGGRGEGKGHKREEESKRSPLASKGEDGKGNTTRGKGVRQADNAADKGRRESLGRPLSSLGPNLNPPSRAPSPPPGDTFVFD